MNDVDAYIAAELDELQKVAAVERQRKADALAAQVAEKKWQEKRAAERRLRSQHTVEVDDECGCGTVSVCLLDVRADDLRAALESQECEEGGDGSFLPASEMRSARFLYLVGRKAEAMDTLYPAIRDALGVAI